MFTLATTQPSRTFLPSLTEFCCLTPSLTSFLYQQNLYF